MTYETELFSKLTLSEFKRKLEVNGCGLMPEGVVPGTSQRVIRAQRGFDPSRVFFFEDGDNGAPVLWQWIVNACVELKLVAADFGA